MKAFVLLTAMPPTLGHLQLLQFANKLADDGVVAIINTQPHEPFVKERVDALRKAIKRTGMTRRVKLIHYAKAIEQDPSAPGFWQMWRDMMAGFGITKDDIAVRAQLSETGKVHAVQGCMRVLEALIEDSEPTEDAVH